MQWVASFMHSYAIIYSASRIKKRPNPLTYTNGIWCIQYFHTIHIRNQCYSELVLLIFIYTVFLVEVSSRTRQLITVRPEFLVKSVLVVKSIVVQRSTITLKPAGCGKLVSSTITTYCSWSVDHHHLLVQMRDLTYSYNQNPENIDSYLTWYSSDQTAWFNSILRSKNKLLALLLNLHLDLKHSQWFTQPKLLCDFCCCLLDSSIHSSSVWVGAQPSRQVGHIKLVSVLEGETSIVFMKLAFMLIGGTFLQFCWSGVSNSRGSGAT